MSTVYLKDHKDLAVEIAIRENSSKFKKDNIDKAVEELIKAGLSYNTKTGETKIKGQVISEPSDKRGIPTYDGEEDVVEWEFTSEILNSASRLERGHTAI